MAELRNELAAHHIQLSMSFTDVVIETSRRKIFRSCAAAQHSEATHDRPEPLALRDCGVTLSLGLPAQPLASGRAGL